MARGGNNSSSFPAPVGVPQSLPGNVPLYQPETVYHVGTLQIADRQQSAWDQEGDCLSVSEYPDEWRAIARLGAGQLWTCQRIDGSAPQFLDALQLDDEQVAHIHAWALEHELVTRETRWIASFEDDEAECTRELVCDSFEEALDEAYGYEEDVREARVLVGQEALCAWSPHAKGLAGGRHSQVEDLVMIAFADQSGYDGIWWHEELAPEIMSAPRGGIAPSAMPKWSFTAT